MLSDDDTTPNASRREQRSCRRRIWRRSLIAGVVVALLAAGTAYAVTGPLQDGDRRGGRASRPGPTSAPLAGTAAAQTCRAPLDPVNPLRLWIGGNGRAVYWVGAPVMADAGYSERVQGVNDVFREVAAKHADVTYVDAYTLFSAPDGTYASMLPVPGGKVARVRGADGIHLTPEGGDLLAETLFDRIDPACKITQQAVPGAVKTTIEAPGSSSVPGSRRDTPT